MGSHAEQPLLAPVALSPVTHKLLSPATHSHTRGRSHRSGSSSSSSTSASASSSRSGSQSCPPSPPPQPIALPGTPPSLLTAPKAYMWELLPMTARNFISQNIGLSLVACAQLFFVLMNLTVKYFLSTTPISALTLIFVRMGITAFFCVGSLLFVVKDENPVLGPKGVRMMLFLRGFCGFVGLLAGYQSLRGLTVSDSVTIQFLTPSVTALFGYLFLKEKMTWREVVAGLFCLSGVLLVSRPPFLFGGEGNNGEILEPDEGSGGTRLNLPPAPVLPGEGDTEGIVTPSRSVSVLWALVLVLATSSAMITIRKIGKKANALHSIGYFSYLCTICCGFALLVDPRPLVWVKSTKEAFLIVTIGIFGFTAQTFLTLGLQREKAGRAGLATYLQVVFALVLEFLLWQTIPSFLSTLGTAIILTSAFWAARSSTKPLQKAKPTDPESLPFSRSPSPIPPPHSNRPSLRDGHYSYDSVHNGADADIDTDQEDAELLKEADGPGGFRSDGPHQASGENARGVQEVDSHSERKVNNGLVDIFTPSPTATKSTGGETDTKLP
ncbi:hypothetical protein I317_07448 [Kwoniella heveanensis CBS 569]|nr:hypothetical protein I317_07448 [Kwoniella heveanensis CBS 569]